MKRCTKCGIEKAASEFSKNKSNKDGLQPRCKGCVKLHYEANKERYREQKKLHYEANKDRYRERKKLYNAKESRRRDEIYIKARIKNGYTREEAVILRDIYKSTNRGEQNRDTCDQLFMAGLI